ncbi:outer membrane protein [Bosea thiooxidans]
MLRGSQIEDVAPAPDLSINWAGFYFGGFGGLSETRFRTDKSVLEIANGNFNGTVVLNELSPAQLVLAPTRTDRGTTFGAFAGYNYAFGDVILGFEAEYSRVDQEAMASTLEARRVASGDVYIASVQNARLNDYFNARVRFGYAYGRLMPYFTIGAAAGRFDTNIAVASDWRSASSNYTTSYFGWPRSIGGPKKDVWGYGWSVGGGLEAALTENLIVRGEYLFTSFNDVEGVTVNVNTARIAAAVKF